eukprot:maker-scaffold227_size249015-snap-gene-1.29 protein:Tk04437 transcript:maker-scaffold227_size249015-snap-gene-1.29-mRNA-1 annotation:"nad-dependent epimerase"
MEIVKSLSLVAVALAVTAWGCEDCSCESQCFTTKEPDLQQAYGHIKSIVNRLKVGRLLASPEIESTIFHFDGSHPSFPSFLYQRRLAAIAALTIPVDVDCNPSMVLNYQDWGSWAWLPTGCLDKCTTATYLSNLANIPAAGGGTNPLGTSCLLAGLLAPRFPCPIQTRTSAYHVAFMNDDIQTPAFPCFGSNSRAAVKIGTVNTPYPPLESLPQLGIQCTTATYLSNLANIPAAGGGTNPLGTSCLLAGLLAPRFPCPIQTRTSAYHVAFMNDDIQTPAFPCFGSNSRAAVKIGTVNTPYPPLESLPQLGIQTQVSSANLKASLNILSCIQRHCCSSRLSPVNLASSRGQFTFLLNGDWSPKTMELDAKMPLMEALTKETFIQEKAYAKTMGMDYRISPSFFKQMEATEGQDVAAFVASVHQQHMRTLPPPIRPRTYAHVTAPRLAPAPRGPAAHLAPVTSGGDIKVVLAQLLQQFTAIGV